MSLRSKSLERLAPAVILLLLRRVAPTPAHETARAGDPRLGGVSGSPRN